MTDSEYDELDYYPEPAVFPRGPLINGTVEVLEPGYPREVRVGQPLLAAVLAAAGFARFALWFAWSLLPGGTTPGSVLRDWKSLRKGPEFLVTPLRLRDTRGVLAEVEIHGYISPSALQRGDLVRGRIRQQRDRELPPRVERIANLTTGQVLHPSPPTFWSHLGPALLLQAVLGGVLLAATLICAIKVF
jgi:hypothetical protein